MTTHLSGDGFGVLVRSRRLAAGLSQEGLAELAGVSVRTVRNVESGRVRRMRASTVRLLADALQVPERERTGLLAMTGDPEALRHAAPAQLPPTAPDFTGRQAELARLRQWLTTPSPATPTVVVSGPAGVGKTALVVRAAHLLRDRFPDGQLYVDLGGAADEPVEAGAALIGFLHALGVDPATVPARLADQSAMLRTLLADRRLLLVLDNARDERQCELLLPGSPGCAVLVTSRTRLAAMTATGYLELSPLPRADAVELLRAVVGEERVAAEPDAAVAIVHACGLLPLAVRIAAARLASRPRWDLAGFAAELADTQRRLGVLQMGSLAVAASLDASYCQLDPPAQHAFRLMAVSDCAELGLPAAAALIDRPPDAARPLLEHLVDVNLLETTAPGRYHYHDLLRLFARDRSRSADTDAERSAALLRLGGLLLAATGEAERVVRRGRPTVTLWQPPAVSAVHRFDSVAEALRWEDTEAVGIATTARQLTGVDIAAAATLLDSAGALLDARGQWAVLWEAAATLAAAAADAGERAAELIALSRLTYVAWRRFEVEPAIEHGTRAIELARQVGDPLLEWRMINLLGAVHAQQCHYAEAAGYFEQAIEVARTAGNDSGAALALANLSLIYTETGRYDEALECGIRGMSEQDRLGNRELYAYAMHGVGAAYLGRGQIEPARRYLQESLRRYRESADASNEPAALLDLARLHRQTGKPAQGLPMCRDALRLHRRRGHQHGTGLALTELGRCLRDLGDQCGARTHWTRALAIFTTLGAPQATEVQALLDETSGREETAGRPA